MKKTHLCHFFRCTYILVCIYALTLTFVLLARTTPTHAQSSVLGPSSASATDQQLLFTSEYCAVGETGFAQQPLAVQTQDSSVFIIACWAGIIIWRGNESASTVLTLPTEWHNPPIVITQHPQTPDVFFGFNGSIFSLQWNVSTQPTFAPPLTTHPYDQIVCPYVCSSVALVFNPDGSHIYAPCNIEASPCEFPSFVVAIALTTQQTVYINMTASQLNMPQQIKQLSFIDDTNELLIVSQLYGITIYDTSQTMSIMQDARSSFSEQPPTPTRVLVAPSACFPQYGTIIDRTASLLMAVCNNLTIVWNLTSKTNISVDPQSGVVVYPQSPSQECDGPFLLYHRPKRTLYQSCGIGPDRVFALQNLDKPQSALFTSLVDVETCSSTSFLMTDRTQPDVLYSMCAEGMMRMEGRGLTSIPNSNLCQEQTELVYDWRTDSTYLICDFFSPALLRFHNHEIEVLLAQSVCVGQQLFFDSSLPHSPQLFVSCGNNLNATASETSLWNISLSLGDEYQPPQLLFTLPLVGSECTFSHVHHILTFYCFVNQQLWVWNASTPELPPFETSLSLDIPILYLQACVDWLFFTCQYASCFYGIPTNRFGLEQPTLLYGNPNETSFSPSNIVCDEMRKRVSLAVAVVPNNIVQLLQVNMSDPNNPIVITFNSFSAGVLVSGAIDIDTELNRVYITIVPNNALTDYLVVFDGETQQFTPSIQIATIAAPSVNDLFVDSHTSQVFISLGAAFDIMYNQISILSSGWRCTTGTSWYQGECRPCPIGESRSVVLSTSESTYSIPQCQSCNAGLIANVSGTIECIACPPSRFADISIGEVCTPCDGGTITNRSGLAECLSCSAGTFARSGSTSCQSCHLGKFSDTKATECSTCSVDAYTPQQGAADCLSCTDQDGLICINGLASVAAGWWPYLVNDTSFDPPLQVYRTTQCPPGYCDGATLQFASSSTNQTSQLCTSPRLNSASNWLCAECEDGYIAWGSSCEPCTGPDIGLICGALILTFIIAYVLLRIDPAASPLTILFFFVQIAALEVGSVTRWIDWIQFANLGAHSFQRCLAPLTPAQQMILTLCIPFLLTTALGILCTLHRLISKYVTPSQWYQSFIFSSSSSSPQPSSRFIRFIGWCSMSYDRDRYLGAINAILIFCYTPVTVTVVSALHCVDVGPDVSRLFSTPSVDCHSSEYRTVLLPFVYVWLCCYVIGLPLFMLLFVFWRWQSVTSIFVQSDLSLPEQASHESLSVLSVNPSNSLLPSESSRLTISSSRSFHARWGHFYRRYRVGAWYWQPIEMLQRFAFALTSVLLIKNSRARYSMYSTISIISLSANLWSHPFASERMNQVALISYFLLSFISFLLNSEEPPYSLTTQLMFFGLIVPFSLILLIWGIRLNLLRLRNPKPMISSVSALHPLSTPTIESSDSPLPTPSDPLLHRCAPNYEQPVGVRQHQPVSKKEMSKNPDAA